MMHSPLERWQDIGRTLEVTETARSRFDVIDTLAANRREAWREYLE